MAKIGDTVRFLNDVGGGIIVRIDGRTAYVRDPEDGFETPMPLTECIVIPSAQPTPETTVKAPAASHCSPSTLTQTISPDLPDRPLTAALLFEPHDIRRLSQTAFDLYLVNDSNFNILYSVTSRSSEIGDWTLVSAGEANGNVQVFLDTFEQIDVNSLANICVQIIAYRADKEFELQPPFATEIHMDLTRLAKLHCFTKTDYSSTPVLTIPLVTAGKVNKPMKLKEIIDEFLSAPAKDTKTPQKPKQEKKARKYEPEVVDLHIHELLDTTAGLSAADMLAAQMREFDRKMEQAAKRPGTKIIFIHGKGEGVLRHAILDRLRRRWPRCEAQDASFREYGFGATQITIHK